MTLFQFNSWKDVLIQLALMVAIAVVFLLGFFYVYLPNTTNHGETITVPDLEGIPLDELDEFLTDRNLRFEINKDSGFSSQYPPLAVLKQFPLPNSKVKENRKIYISLNAKEPPKVRMPQLVDGSVKNAQVVLKSYDLLLGEITYASDMALNAVLKQLYQGKPISEGASVPKGAKIDLIVGDGLGNQVFNAPTLIGLTYEDAEFSVIGQGLKVGDVHYEEDGKATIEVKSADGTVTYQEQSMPLGTVFKQSPSADKKIKIGDYIDLWIVGTEPERFN
ncbi:PASTA domain-containing protein [Imperialibacter roseus]|uniref:PASTA domain-containing protein n=1 Tax=Imperialibacter roseus TaxID=1324217 RepID=A0ABZ0IUC2_9BACT|nr:PASTA domain-containing protein [Imperialibacter roseus]WOK07296.1 PASTA domain-containing protein [Imperialibacter roseus]|tara:strand:+ start:642 stop:1472 length:831 start_codon:yes stop_codon:yes gene_type:complete